MRHRRFLPRIHLYRKMKKQFDGNKEASSTPSAFRGKEVYDMVNDIDVYLAPLLGRSCDTVERRGTSMGYVQMRELHFTRHVVLHHQ